MISKKPLTPLEFNRPFLHLTTLNPTEPSNDRIVPLPTPSPKSFSPPVLTLNLIGIRNSLTPYSHSVAPSLVPPPSPLTRPSSLKICPCLDSSITKVLTPLTPHQILSPTISKFALENSRNSSPKFSNALRICRKR